jgi:hypothetical protein
MRCQQDAGGQRQDLAGTTSSRTLPKPADGQLAVTAKVDCRATARIHSPGQERQVHDSADICHWSARVWRRERMSRGAHLLGLPRVHHLSASLSAWPRSLGAVRPQSPHQLRELSHVYLRCVKHSIQRIRSSSHFWRGGWSPSRKCWAIPVKSMNGGERFSSSAATMRRASRWPWTWR